MKINTTKFNIIILVVFIFFAFYGEAKALTLSPVRIEINGDPGTTVTKDITLFNDGKSEETYYVTYANFEAQGETGSPLFVEPKSDLGTWMSSETASVTLKPNETKNISFKITIPKDAYAGGHFAAVFFGNNPAGGQISVGAKIGTLVLLSVNGNALEAGGLASFNTLNHKFFYNSLPVSLEYRWKNDGNDRVKPDGSVTIRDMFYIPVDHINANAVSGNILPRSTRLFNLSWAKENTDIDLNTSADTNNVEAGVKSSFISSFFDKVEYQWNNFAVGLYFAKLDLAYGVEKIHSNKTAIFFVFPWQMLLCFFVGFVVLYFVGKKFLKKYNRYIIEKAQSNV